MRIRWVITGLLALDLAVLSFVGCGSRSALPGGPTASDGGSGVDGGTDAADAPDFPNDATVDCADPSTKLIYLVTGDDLLFSFDPPSATFALRGQLGCAPESSPYSMGVDRKGVAYVEYKNDHLYEVSTKNAACKPTTYKPESAGFFNFGMGFSLDGEGADTDHLYVAVVNDIDDLGLATIDTQTFALDPIGPFDHPPGHEVELTGSSDGNLWGYFLDGEGNGTIASIDKSNAHITMTLPASVGGNGPATSLAFAFWNGNFYIFTTFGTKQTSVHEYDTSTSHLTFVTTLDHEVVGAGVSTCTTAE